MFISRILVKRGHGVSLNMEKKWAFPLLISFFLCIFLMSTSFNNNIVYSADPINSFLSLFPSWIATTHQAKPVFAEEKIAKSPPPPYHTEIPHFAYLVSGSKGDMEKLWRTLQALYHPWNQYVVHLDLESSLVERLELASRVQKDPIFAKVGNVHMMTKANMVTYRGPTMVANTLHACAILLMRSKDWDWFINLSASDYPLVTQDDLLSTFSTLNRNLNFVEHTSKLDWKEEKRALPLIIDPGLYMSNKSDIFEATPKRTLPTAFKLFTGSAWMVLSRSFVEYCIWSWDNLPRVLLMYYTNVVSSPESYFQTVICNVPEFARTAVNHDLHYISWDLPPKQHPHDLSVNDLTRIIRSGAPFARKFKQDDPALDLVDKYLLHRQNGNFTPGGWCSGNPDCFEVGDPTRLRPGPGLIRLRELVASLALIAKSGENQCK